MERFIVRAMKVQVVMVEIITVPNFESGDLTWVIRFRRKKKEN